MLQIYTFYHFNMAIFYNKNCLYKYERYKETEKQTTSVKPPHKHIRDINQILEKEKIKKI